MSFIELDIKTILRLLAIGNLVAIALLMAYGHKGEERPLRWFLFGKAFQTAGWVLISLRNDIPFMLSMHLGNSLLCSGFALETIAYVYSSAWRERLVWFFAWLQLCGMFMLWIYQDSPSNLVAGASLWCILLWAPAGFFLWREPGASRLQKTVALFFLVLCAAVALRIHDALMMNVSLFSRSPGQYATFIALFTMMIVGSVGFILLMKERLDSQLAHTNQRLLASLRGGKLATWEWNIPKNENKMDEAWLGMLGYVPGELPETFDTFRRLMHPDDLVVMEAAAAAHLSGKNEFYEADFRLRTKDGGWRWIHSGGLALDRDEQGQVVHMAGIHLDITQQRQAEEAKKAFVSMVSHELRTPINAIIGMSLRALRTELNAQQHDYISKIANSSELLLRVINDILDFSKLEAGKLELERRPFLLQDMLSRVVDISRMAIEARGLKFSLEIAPDAPPALLGDALRLEQVLINLTSNAAKFTDKGEVLLLVKVGRREAAATELIFSVRDTGIGIAPAKLAELFIPFSQLDDSLTRRHGGTGLGLSISQQLIGLMGGHIWAESTPGQGSTFQFVVNLDIAPQPQDSGNAYQLQPTPPPARLEGKRILLVEDNAFNRQVTQEMLEDAGIIVDLAVHGREAVDKTRTFRPDAILMDIQMPVMDGLEATRKIRTDPSLAKVPIIAMTAHGMQEMKQQGMKAGFNAYLVKPITADVLYATLLQWLPVDTPLPETTDITTKEIDLPEALPGIDMALALKMVGGQRNRLVSRIKYFVMEMGESGSQLQQLAKDNQWTELWRLAHALKGAAGTLGARVLQALADTLLKEEDESRRRALVQEILQELDKIMESAARLSAQDRPAATIPAKVHEAASLRQTWNELAEKVSRNLYIAEDSLNVLEAGLTDEASRADMQRLRTALASFDYATAGKFVESCINRMDGKV